MLLGGAGGGAVREPLSVSMGSMVDEADVVVEAFQMSVVDVLLLCLLSVWHMRRLMADKTDSPPLMWCGGDY